MNEEQINALVAKAVDEALAKVSQQKEEPEAQGDGSQTFTKEELEALEASVNEKQSQLDTLTVDLEKNKKELADYQKLAKGTTLTSKELEHKRTMNRLLGRK